MGAPKGNQFWKARTRHGNTKLFSSSDVLWDAACEYFQWVEENPIYESKAFSYQGVTTLTEIPKMRAMTIEGLCLFLGIDDQTLFNYGSAEGYEDFFDVVKKIKSVIYNQKFVGAAADQLNSNIIARDLGLADKRDVEVSEKDVTPWGSVKAGVDE